MRTEPELTNFAADDPDASRLASSPTAPGQTNAVPSPASVSNSNASDSGSESSDESISIKDFGRVQLRVAQIMAAERVPGSEKLLKLRVELGDVLGPRQIIAGIGKHYEPESIIGRKIVVVANLKPAKLMGHTSEGMLLAASDAHGNLELLSPGFAMPAGSIVR